MKSKSQKFPRVLSCCTLSLAIASSSCSGDSDSGAIQSVGGAVNAGGGSHAAGSTAPTPTTGLGGLTASSGGSSALGSSPTQGGQVGETSGGTSGSTGGGVASTTASGGRATGGSTSTGGSPGAGGKANAGGSAASGGKTSSGGMSSAGGKTSGGGSSSAGGKTAVGGVTGAGGVTQSGGTPSTGGAAGSGNSTGTVVNGCIVKMEGWAAVAGTTGGGNATPQRVASVAELRTLAKDDVPRVLELVGTYDLGATYLAVGSNKTFIGIGKNVVVKASVAGFSLRHSQNIILRNFTVNGGGDVGTEGGDAITATVADRLWFDHLTITDGPDGILDLTQGTTNATISWCKIYYTSSNQPHRYAMQFSSGSGSGATDKGKLDITMHHNWFGDLVNQRMPRHLWGRGHVYNSFYNSPGNEYCIGAGSLASLLIENNYFKDVVDPFRLQDNGPVHIVAKGNIFDNATGKQETGALGSGTAGPAPAPFSPTYPYTLDEAKAVPELVKRCAGPQ